MQLQILNQGKHHVVVNKPYNMVVVAGRGVPRPTLLDLAVKEIGKGVKPVHRIDRVTTGCCILATTLYGQQALSNAFRRHLIHKQYLAIIEGVPNFKTINIDARLQRVDSPNAKRGYLANQTIDDEGKRALTRVEVLASNAEFSLIKATPQTGRMHQIRAHLAHIGHPIVGDKQYGSTVLFAEKAIGLFAWMLSFPPPEGGKRLTVEAPFPEEFKRFLKTQDIKFELKSKKTVQE